MVSLKDISVRCGVSVATVSKALNGHKDVSAATREKLLKAAKETGCIVTSEEHSVVGGLGGAVCEFLSGTCPVPVVRHGVNDVFGRSGTYADVLAYFGITPEGIADKARKALALKRG